MTREKVMEIIGGLIIDLLKDGGMLENNME